MDPYTPLNWFNIIGSVYVIGLFLLISVIFYSARTWSKSNNQLSNTVKKVGENLEKITSELGKDTSQLREALGTHTSEFTQKTAELRDEIGKNRDAIQNFDETFRKVYWWLK